MEVASTLARACGVVCEHLQACIYKDLLRCLLLHHGPLFRAGIATLAEAAHRHILRLHHSSQVAALAAAAAIQQQQMKGATGEERSTPGGGTPREVPSGMGGAPAMSPPPTGTTPQPEAVAVNDDTGGGAGSMLDGHAASVTVPACSLIVNETSACEAAGARQHAYFWSKGNALASLGSVIQAYRHFLFDVYFFSLSPSPRSASL